jgi:hypothetical protein
MGGERNHRRDMEPSDDRLNELAVRVQLLPAQRPARAAECVAVPLLPVYGLYPKRMKGDADG